MNHIAEINPYFNSLENLLGFIESYNPSEVIIFSPRLNIGFLWKFIDDISLYRKKILKTFMFIFHDLINLMDFTSHLMNVLNYRNYFQKLKFSMWIWIR